jgi:1-deoxy-D-xylulose-5-phosphate synthase
MLMIGLPDRFVEQGSQSELRALYGLDAAGIAGRIRAALGRETGTRKAAVS